TWTRSRRSTRRTSRPSVTTGPPARPSPSGSCRPADRLRSRPWPTSRPDPSGRLGAMAGAIAIVVDLLIFPSLVLVSDGVDPAILGFCLQKDGEARHDGSEHLDLDD